jgi:outer membrane receptor protein involved in Fe transport
MKMFGKLVVALLFTGAAGAAQAQQPGGPPGMRPGTGPGMGQMPSGEVRGVVQDGTSLRPLGSASVAVHSVRDSTLVTGALTRADGGFRIEGLRPGRYYVRVSFIGYAPELTGEFTLTPNALQADLGAIKLAQAAVAVDGVTATAERSQVTIAPDRNVFNVRDMPAVAGGTATDALRNVPSLEVDIDGRVSLRGSQNVAVQINGRAAPMRGDQLAMFLQQLPANMLERIEVIPNPSARFDPEGMAGIINIVLRQNADLGTSYGFSASAGTNDRYNLSGNVGHQQGPLTLFSSYGFFTDQRESKGFNYRENRFASPLTILEQDVDGTFSPTSHNFNASAEYKLGRRDVVNSSLMLSAREMENSSINIYRDLTSDRALTGQTLRTQTSLNDGLTFDYGLGFRRTIQPRTHELSADLRLNRNRNDAQNLFRHQLLGLDGTNATDQPGLQTNELDAATTNYSLQLDYTRPLGTATRLETGYRGTLRQMDNDFTVSSFDSALGYYVIDADRTNSFRFDEQVHAAYGVLGHTLGKLNLQGGLRMEQALTDFDLKTTNERFENDYFSFFPSGLVAYNLSDQQQLRASYSKRVRRPDTGQLNPFALAGGRGPGETEDHLNLFRGNPYLKPEYTHAFELGYQRTGTLGTLQVSPYFRRTTDAVRRVKTIDDSGVSTTTFQNLASSDSYGTDVTGSFRLGRLNGFGGFNAYRVVTDGSNLDTDVSNDAFTWSTRGSVTYRVNPSFDLQGFVMYRAPMDVELGRISSMTMSNLSARYRFNQRANVSLRVMDPFNLMNFSFTTFDDRHFQKSTRQFGARGAFLTFQYSYGQQPRVRQRPQPEQDEQPQIGIQ